MGMRWLRWLFWLSTVAIVVWAYVRLVRDERTKGREAIQLEAAGE